MSGNTQRKNQIPGRQLTNQRRIQAQQCDIPVQWLLELMKTNWSCMVVFDTVPNMKGSFWFMVFRYQKFKMVRNRNWWCKRNQTNSKFWSFIGQSNLFKFNINLDFNWWIFTQIRIYFAGRRIQLFRFEKSSSSNPFYLWYPNQWLIWSRGNCWPIRRQEAFGLHLWWL